MIRTEIGKYIADTSLSRMSTSRGKPAWAHGCEFGGFHTCCKASRKAYEAVYCSLRLGQLLPCLNYADTREARKNRFAYVDYLLLSHAEAAY